MSASPAGPFEHIGLLYRDEDEYVSQCAAFLEEALAAGAPALVAVPGGGTAIRDRLGTRADEVVFKDMSVAGRNPGRIIPSVLLAFAEAHSGRRVWVIGEPIWKGRSALEYPACAAHEALINAAFAGRDAVILCPYDVSRLEPYALDDAERTHPVMQDPAGSWPSPAYTDPVEAVALFDRPLPAPPARAASHTFNGTGGLPGVRAFLAERAAAAGLGERRVGELLIAMNELASNTAEHTCGPGTVTVWVEDGTLVYQLDDSGRLDDPLAGRVPPPDTATRGRGLIIVNELADLVRVHRRPSGTSVRLHFDPAGAYQPATGYQP
ncbi:anti-sigma regulatory factor [Sphaerisporangium siamense]|uniref:Anti-sigma regulatory factor (Ser/Thr protein kinase) n=1 Tax=Sphaerisporangium siamense TaxID=795645 RepID=A0A7W7D5L1_9ACTN|nr:anti-sigma factor RsbA family regulatory protein [Sphaerisporangium siamense]MBB4700531.1 anti-sigma regulatory factor (Ser/Thr protein kinase) [Sphaerisporangium siamense]GII88306.1 anti-sigma regulatory factor [Sphaerisporangium siamense]